VLAAIAERTERLRLGTGVTLLGSLDPVRAAEDYGTLDALSGGRVEVVCGRGVISRTYSDLGYDPADSRELFDEHVELLLELWTREDVDWDGKHRGPLRGVTVKPRPVQQPHPPIWIGGGSSTASIDLAARLGLRLMLPSVLAPPEAFLPFVERYREQWELAGRDEGDLCVGACSHVHVGPDSAAARKRWEPHHMAYVNWVGELFRWGGVNVGSGGGGGARAGFGPAPDYEQLLAESLELFASEVLPVVTS